MGAFENLIGKSFGGHAVIARAPSRNGHTYWVVRCECGIETVRDAYKIKRELNCRCASRCGPTEFRLIDLPEYRTWRDMLRRCYGGADARTLKYYRDRGITVCERWRSSFQNFLSDMGPRPSARYSIDRYPDNTGNYEPTNCRWATRAQQRSNMRPRRSTRSA